MVGEEVYRKGEWIGGGGVRRRGKHKVVVERDAYAKINHTHTHIYTHTSTVTIPDNEPKGQLGRASLQPRSTFHQKEEEDWALLLP